MQFWNLYYELQSLQLLHSCFYPIHPNVSLHLVHIWTKTFIDPQSQILDIVGFFTLHVHAFLGKVQCKYNFI